MLDWERFQRIIQPNQENKLSSLELIIEESEFLIDFLKHLSIELKQLKTISECVKQFPHAGTHLSTASVHPFIGYNKTIVQLLMECLIEYSKLSEELASQNAANEYNDNIEKKSVLWCIIRLRRLLSCNISTKQQQEDSGTQLIQKQIRHISTILETKGDDISNECITELTNACLGLLDHSIETASLIERLVSLAVPFNKDDIHFDKKMACLSNQFLYKLIHSPSQLRELYQTWSPKLKARLWLQYNDILEMELLDLIEKYTQETYISKQALSQHIQHHPLIMTANQYQALHQKIVFNTAEFIVISLCDYRLIKFNQCIQPQLGFTVNQLPRDVYHDLQNYIYDGSMEDIEKKRNVAWCFALGLWDVLFFTVGSIIEWCRGNDVWTKEMEDATVYINWLICPSLDNREYESLSLLRCWLQSNQDANDQSKFYQSLCFQWHQIFRENKIVLACFLTVILGSSTTRLTKDQKISLINDIILAKQSTNDKNSAGVDVSVAYCILDFLYEIKDKKSSHNDVDELINHVNKHI